MTSRFPKKMDAGLLEESSSEYVWNFAYGSNMNTAILGGRRGIKPLESVPARLRGWNLNFSLRALPFVEPGMGNASPNNKPGVEMHGVAHKLTLEDYEILKRTEGGAGEHADGYQLTEVVLNLYDGRNVKAIVLEAKGQRVTQAPMTLLPSLRYISLLREGARQHDLAPAYITYLDAIPAYEGGCLMKSLVLGCLLLSALVLSPVLLPWALYVFCCGGKRGPLSRGFFNLATGAVWCTFGALPGCGVVPLDTIALEFVAADGDGGDGEGGAAGGAVEAAAL